MTALTQAAAADDLLLYVDEAAPSPGAFFTIDDESIRLVGSQRPIPSQPSTIWIVERGVAGTTAATHADEATLTRYYPEAPGGGTGSVEPPLVLSNVDQTATILKVEAAPDQSSLSDGPLFVVQGANEAAVVHVAANGVTTLQGMGTVNDVLQVKTSGDDMVVEVFAKGGMYLASAETSGNPILYVDGTILGAAARLVAVERSGGFMRVGYNLDVDIQPTDAVAAAGAVFTVRDEAGDKVFEIRNDGTVHIKTGGSVTADL